MQLSDLLAESPQAGLPGQRPATSAEQSDGAAPFAAMVLEALRASGGDIAPEIDSELIETDHSLVSAPVSVDVDEAVGQDIDTSSPDVSVATSKSGAADVSVAANGSGAAGQSVAADGSASSTSATAGAELGRVANATVVALGISGDATGRPHIESRHVASEAADVVLGELRSMLEPSEPVGTDARSVESEPDPRITKEALPAAPSPRSASSMRVPEATDAVEILTEEPGEDARSESGDFSIDGADRKASGESSDRPVDRLAPTEIGPDAQSRASSMTDAGRANAASRNASSHNASLHNASTPGSSSPNASSVASESTATIPAATGAEMNSTAPGQEPDRSDTSYRTAPEVISVSRSANRQATSLDSEENVPTDSEADVGSAPAEKRGARGKAVRPETASPSERDAIPAEFRAMAASNENGQPIASPSEEFFETENVSVEEVTQSALPDGPVQESADDPRSVEGRPIASTDVQSDRAQASREVTMPRAVVSAAWLRAMMEQGLRIHNEPEGWNSVTMRLGDEDGTMTVRTRREDGSMAVQVAFSDSNLRMTAVQNIERLEAALRAQYDTAIDLSLSDSGSRPDDDDHRPSAANRSRTPIATDHETRDITRRSPWARNEWVV